MNRLTLLLEIKGQVECPRKGTIATGRCVIEQARVECNVGCPKAVKPTPKSARHLSRSKFGQFITQLFWAETASDLSSLPFDPDMVRMAADKALCAQGRMVRACDLLACIPPRDGTDALHDAALTALYMKWLLDCREDEAAPLLRGVGLFPKRAHSARLVLAVQDMERYMRRAAKARGLLP